MAPAGGKRKRGDGRNYSQDDDNSPRPSPHRPQNLNLAHAQQQNNSPRGGRRGSRTGGRGGNSNTPHSPNVTHTSPTAMSPPSSNSFQISKSSQPTPSTPTPSTEQPSTRTPPAETPESNEYLTPDRVANWSTEARDAVVQAAQLAQRDGDILTLAVVFHEILEASIHQLMNGKELGSMVREIVAAPADDLVDPVSTFLDTMSSLTEDEEKHKSLRQLLIATDIDVSRMRSELESGLLTSLDLVRPSFPRVAVRKATHALYRQSNYNLLREETEGYSKLMTEYFTTVNNAPPTQEVVNETYQRVNALIGAFDLDIGRVLDVTLDVFANLLVKHCRFFVKLLRSSAWWPEPRGLPGIEWIQPEVATLPHWALPGSPVWYDSDQEKNNQLQLREERDRKFWQRVGELDKNGIQAYFELGARHILKDNRESNQPDAESAQSSTKHVAQQWADDWMKQTKTLPPSGNEIAAQLLGFKLRFYASDVRDAHDILPDNLINLAALLIKIGFISIMDLYPHLYPLEENMPAHKEKLLKAKKEKEDKLKGKATNALAMAGALPDDTPAPPSGVARLREAESKSSSKSESERSTPAKSDDGADKKDKLPEPVDQKVALLRNLLCIGAIPEALFILGRHPWLLEVYPDLPTYIFRLAHHSLSNVYDDARPIPLNEVPSVSKGAGVQGLPRPSDFVPRRTLRWAKLEERDAGDGIDYRFYWEEWMDNVPVCQSVDDVFKLCTSLLGLIGPECGKDTVLLTKLARIGKKSMADDTSPENRKRWVDFSSTFLAPALTFTSHNSGLVNEIWDLLKQFDTATRYTIYKQWFGSTKPALRAAFKETENATKSLLGRISAQNTKDMGRKMAKLAYACPGIVFKQTLRQGQSYVNMIGALVECSQYLTYLGYDCLTWTLVNTFVSNDRDARQGDGMVTAPWLKHTALFIGKAYRRHPYMDPTPVLQFIAHQLLRPEGDLYMLAVLEQIITSMGGIGLSGALTESIVLALNAGPILRTFTLQHHLSDNRHEAKSSVRRLIRCLKETGLAPQILIALAQHVEAYIHRSDLQEAPDKVVLTNLDNLRFNFAQYLELLRTHIPVDEFDGIFPDVVELMSEFAVEPSVAFTISRASIAAKANISRMEKQPISNSTEVETADGDVVMKEAEANHAVNGVAPPTGKMGKDMPSTSEDTEMNDAAQTTDIEMKDASTSAVSPTSVTNPEIERIAVQLKMVLPDTFEGHPSLLFYVTFWQLSLMDVDDGGIKQQYRDAIAFFQRKVTTHGSDRRYGQESSEKRKAREEVSRFTEEQESVHNAVALTQHHLRQEMGGWFEGIPMLDSRSDALHNALLQDCFIPRACMSVQDAQYASAMLKFMHRAGVPGFRTIKILDLLFTTNKLGCIIAMYTEEESKNFGRFLSDVLRELQVWHENKDNAYIKSAHGPDKNLPGFGRRFNPDRTPMELLSFEDFCMLLYKWHKALFTALKTAIESGEYMEIRNSINILKALSPTFPKVDVMAKELRQPLQNMASNDDRDDVKTAAGSILYEFQRSQKFWKSEGQFRNLPNAPPPNVGNSKPVIEKANTPQPQDTSTTKLNVKAPAFRPGATDSKSTKSTTEISTPAVSGPRGMEKDQIKPAAAAHKVPGPNQVERVPNKPTPNAGLSSAPPQSISGRPDNHNGPAPSAPSGRVSHGLPTRPDAQPRSRPLDRPGGDRQNDYMVPHSRHDNRGPHPSEYGRLERSVDPREREASPGRRPPRARTPDRGPGREWVTRDAREYDERSLRQPQRDIRPPPGRPPTWDPRDTRDQRDRIDSRGHPQSQPMEPRRMHSNSALNADERRRDVSYSTHQGGERNGPPLPRPSQATTPSASDTMMINPERAALINEEQVRVDAPRPDRDNRRERNSRQQSPRRGDERRPDERRGDERRPEERPPTYHGRNETGHHREERNQSQAYSASRDRRDDPTANTPTGPRGGGRGEAAQSSRVSRDMFQPSQGQRAQNHQIQDPNYGRLNPPIDTTPSGPRNPAADRRDTQSQQAPVHTTPSAPVGQHGTAVHTSRMNQFRTPSIQTDVPGAPSGPRGSGRSNQGPPPSPLSRATPTGPASMPRNQKIINTIQSTMNQPNERAAPPQNPPVRGRGSIRANDAPPGNMNSPLTSQSHPSTPSTRSDGQHSRPGRAENTPGRLENAFHDEGRLDSRSHRESRRSERSGHEHGHSREGSERRPEEKTPRNGTSDRNNRGDEQERPNERERGGREKRRDREREGGERSGRERRDRGSRDDGRASGRESTREAGREAAGREAVPREERERRSRDDGRKRGRDATDQPHGDMKRSRR